MTPNKPEVAKIARDMIDMHNSSMSNNTLILVGRLADTITYNAEVMNKLVKRVEQLEALQVKPQVAPVVEKEQGEYLELVLKDKRVTLVRCTHARSKDYIEGKVYKVEHELDDTPYVTSENGFACNISMSLFVKVENEPVIGHKLHVLLADHSVQLVKCVKSNSQLWVEGKVYVVLTSTTIGSSRKVQSEDGQLLCTSGSLFVEVKPESSKVMHVDNPLTEEQLLNMFLEQTRMFMGLPTIHLIKPCSL